MAIDSSSFRADFLIRTLYLATSLQILDDVLERIVRFFLPNFESFDVAGILGERGSDRLIDEFGDASIRFCRLETQCAMQVRIEIDGGTVLCGVVPLFTVASRRCDVKTLRNLEFEPVARLCVQLRLPPGCCLGCGFVLGREIPWGMGIGVRSGMSTAVVWVFARWGDTTRSSPDADVDGPVGRLASDGLRSRR